MERHNSQNINNNTFYRLPVTSAHVVIGKERYPDKSLLLNYAHDIYCQGYGKIKEAFRALTKDDILQPYISEDDFGSSTGGDNFGYNEHSCDIRYQKNFENAQPANVEFKFHGIIPAGVNRYALVLKNRLASISSDGQRMFDLS